MFAVRTNEEVAQILEMSIDFLKRSMLTILDKLNIYSREDAVLLYRFYREEGIL